MQERKILLAWAYLTGNFGKLVFARILMESLAEASGRQNLTYVMKVVATSPMMRRFLGVICKNLSTATVVAVASACRLVTGSDDQDLTRCPQTFEFGNYGCARVTLLVEGPPKPWPELYRFDIRAVAVRKDAGFDSVRLVLRLPKSALLSIAR